MPASILAALLTIGLQATAAPAQATPAGAESTAVDRGVVAPEPRTLRSGVHQEPAAVPLRSERKAEPRQPQVLGRDFARPKPVQVYWFFGGR